MADDNRTPTPGKNPWMARPRTYENETVSVARGPAHTEHGYTRDVYLSQVINEPGKGGTNPPRREIVTRLHSDDAITLGLHLVENGISAERRNAADGEGGEREPFFEHPEGHGERRMPEDFARTNLRLLEAVLARVQDWQDANPNTIDYRVTGALDEGRKVRAYLKYLADDTTPDADAARRELAAKGMYESAHYGQEPGALTGHAETDARPVSRRVPRITAPGKYYVTATLSVPVTVVDVTATDVELVVRGDHAGDYPDGITAPRAELGTWLTLDNPRDWTTTDD
jgi:hypothetical protein